MRARFALVIGLACAPAMLSAASQPARPNIYAPTYDVRMEILPDGSLDVIESIALSVGAKPITWFDRTIPARRTDGLTNVVALMDGQSVPVKIDQRSDLKVRWDFSPTANATHSFEIRYRALRVLAREIDGPRLVWTALPRRHTYPIDSAEITLFAPAGSVATYVGAPGGDVLSATAGRPGVVIAGKALKRDRTVTVDITFAPNSIKPVEPQWFVEQDRQLQMLPAWIAGAASLLVVGVGILVMAFARLPRPAAPGADGGFVSPAAEGTVPPALATLLLGRSQSNSWLAMQSAFFRMVRDGFVIIEKRGDRRGWRGAAFDVTLGSAAMPGALVDAPHEEWILSGVRSEGARPDMRRLMLRLSRRQREFRVMLMGEAASRGWIDIERQLARRWLSATGRVLVVTGLVCAGATLALADRFGPAPAAIPAVVFLVGLIYIIVAGVMSVFSESGVREAARWQARVDELKNTIKDGVSGQSPKDFERWFPLAIGAGIGAKWLRAFDAQLAASGADLGWLKAMGSPADAASSLAAMVAISGASHAGGAGGAGGGAGGGSSGAG